jgi:hypothetical protein
MSSWFTRIEWHSSVSNSLEQIKNVLASGTSQAAACPIPVDAIAQASEIHGESAKFPRRDYVSVDVAWQTHLLERA